MDEWQPVCFLFSVFWPLVLVAEPAKPAKPAEPGNS